MGRIFLDHPGGTTLYSCANCDTALTNRSELTSMVRMRINSGDPSDYLRSAFTAKKYVVGKCDADCPLAHCNTCENRWEKVK